ncbi:MAG: hypothetical protein GC131_09050 [Alphaproteobacteria bacterium]|nr:hypothetical protein [Alphaproteobacteria bacterium]
MLSILYHFFNVKMGFFVWKGFIYIKPYLFVAPYNKYIPGLVPPSHTRTTQKFLYRVNGAQKLPVGGGPGKRLQKNPRNLQRPAGRQRGKDKHGIPVRNQRRDRIRVGVCFSRPSRAPRRRRSIARRRGCPRARLPIRVVLHQRFARSGGLHQRAQMRRNKALLQIYRERQRVCAPVQRREPVIRPRHVHATPVHTLISTIGIALL